MSCLTAWMLASIVVGAPGIIPPPRISADTGTGLDLLQLDRVVRGSGTLEGSRIRPIKNTPVPRFEVLETGGRRVLRASGTGAAAWFHRRLLPEIREAGMGTLRWSWRVLRAPEGADLRVRERDDAPLRVFVVFGNPEAIFGGGGRIVFYTWGNGEPEGLTLPSFVSDRIEIVRLAGAAEVSPRWRNEVVHPFEDYRRIWNRDPPPITAIGLMQDTDMTQASAVAELRQLNWHD